MKIRIENNIAEIWCAANTPEDELEKQILSLRKQHYTVAVFKSGKGDLADLTYELLRINNT